MSQAKKSEVLGRGTPRGTRILETYVGPILTAPVESEKRFPDGCQMRIEIPSVENPAALKAVVQEAAARKVSVHRVSQGSGASLLSVAELCEMAAIGADAGLEVNLFIGPREEYGVGATVRGADGMFLSGRLRGMGQLRYAIEDVFRAVDAGIRGFLIADMGLLELLGTMVSNGELPNDIVWKVSAVLAPSNPVSFRQLIATAEHVTVNVPSDMTLVELAELRTVSDAPIDLYLEAPDAMGGMVRGNETLEIALVAAPLYAKFGLRNARAVYPAGLHLQGDVEANVREKVRRAGLALEWVEASGETVSISQPGAIGIGVPRP